MPENALPIAREHERVAQRPNAAALVFSVALSLAFALLAGRHLGALAWEYDEGWYSLAGRFLNQGRRPFVDFAYMQPPLHPYLLAVSAQIFGDSVFGFRMLSLISLGGTGIVLFLLVRPALGVLAAIFAQALFLFSTTQLHALAAVPDTPMMLLAMFGTLLLLHGTTTASLCAAAIAFVAALFVKPTCLLMILVAAGSLLVDGRYRRFLQLAATGVAASVLALMLVIYASDGVFLEVLRYQLIDRLGTRRATMWTISSGFTDFSVHAELDGARDLALFAAKDFLGYPTRSAPLWIAIASLAGLPLWLAAFRRNRALCTFVLLAPAAFAFVNLVLMDFVSAKYFVPFPAFVALLSAALVWGACRVVPRAVMLGGVLAAVTALAVPFVDALSQGADPWYGERAGYLAAQPGEIASFTPMFFLSSGREPGCAMWNPALSYGPFGQAMLAEGMARFRVSDADLVACLRSDPDARMLVDFWFYYFTRGRGDLNRYLREEGARQIVFLSPDAQRRWSNRFEDIGGVQR
ncbi:MAG TPA: glycosyltransferase family 39 protein [Candidatus Binatia bacterium]|nr:glycosyltransferase family 39 protein [Candidatus Binatia bacterium]